MELKLSFSRSKLKSQDAGPVVEQRSTNLMNPAQWLKDFFLGTGALGVGYSSQESGLTLAAVYSCIRLISENIAAFPVDLVQRTSEGRKIDLKHPSIQVLKFRPSPSLTSFDWRELMQGQALTEGDGVSRIIRDDNGFPISLKYYRTTEVEFVCNDNGLPFYGFPDQKELTGHMDVIHIKAFGDTGIRGKSPIALHRDTIGTGLKAQKYNSKYYENGGWLKGFLKFPGKLDKGRPAQLSKEWDDTYGGEENAFKTMVLHSGSSFETANISQRDAQYIESMKFTREQVAGIFNVNPGMIGDTDKMNFSVMEQIDLQFVKYTIRPWLKKWEQELNFKLLTNEQRAAGYQFKFNVNALLRADAKTRGEYYGKMLSHGVYNPNEVRDLEGKDARPGGDNFFNMVNTQTQKQFDLAEQKTAAEIENLKKQD